MKLEEVWKVLEKEFKGKAVKDDGSCAYKLSDGRKCAIGCFIPEGHEAQRSKHSITYLLNRYPKLLKHMPCIDHKLLRKFQIFHDNKITARASVKEQRAALFNHYVKLYREYNEGNG